MKGGSDTDDRNRITCRLGIVYSKVSLVERDVSSSSTATQPLKSLSLPHGRRSLLLGRDCTQILGLLKKHESNGQVERSLRSSKGEVGQVVAKHGLSPFHPSKGNPSG